MLSLIDLGAGTLVTSLSIYALSLLLGLQFPALCEFVRMGRPGIVQPVCLISVMYNLQENKRAGTDCMRALIVLSNGTSLKVRIKDGTNGFTANDSYNRFKVCVVASHAEKSGGTPAGVNPFSPKAYVVQYWTKHISNDLPKPSFLIEKASPLTAVETATFTKLVARNALSTQLPSFCSSAKLLCFPDLVASLEKHKKSSNDGFQVNIPDSVLDKIRYRKIANKEIKPGEFFREEMLKAGNVMPMPDIRDKTPKRSFLPRVISSILPFSTSRISEMKKIFHAGDNSAMTRVLTEALTECERAPERDETKRCVGSMEDMIDFATSILGRNVVVRTTDNSEGSKQNVMIGAVKGINGGKVTKAVSCHQILFPYLIYYCHSVSKVRIYEADILDSTTKTKINNGLAICHVDTSAWSPRHAAFVALGSGPGKIEVCHWIFENNMN
ncbi:hypothetical protein LguiA_002530 [Lonicera macranthoides]